MSADITKLLPHRRPFLFLDDVATREDGVIIGRHLFDENEFFFSGHFPGYPVVPGVILIESMAQCGGAALVQEGAIPREFHFFLATVRDVKFRRKVTPGETVRFEVRTMRVTKKMFRQRGLCYVGDELTAEADWMCIITPQGAE
jgi:3-hydroxyacyl-[acyl-carrier-protein] dehydratase